MWWEPRDDAIEYLVSYLTRCIMNKRFSELPITTLCKYSEKIKLCSTPPILYVNVLEVIFSNFCCLVKHIYYSVSNQYGEVNKKRQNLNGTSHQPTRGNLMIKSLDKYKIITTQEMMRNDVNQ